MKIGKSVGKHLLSKVLSPESRYNFEASNQDDDEPSMTRQQLAQSQDSAELESFWGILKTVALFVLG